MEVYIISDLHLGHKNMAKYRGFNSVEEHDNHIVKCWNSVVRKKDTVWILGDIGMEKSSSYHLLDQMLGIKKVVLGNHDKPQHIQELLKYVNLVCGMIKYKGFWLTHAPIHPAELYRGHNIHGHVHNKTIKKWYGVKDNRYINVSAEIVNYTPQLISKYIKYGKKKI